MKKTYRTPSLDVHMYRLSYNSVFTDSGDKLDDDIYDVTVNGGNKISEDVFGN